jgi:membrane-associated protease RseP (regulator of RpoE activity)
MTVILGFLFKGLYDLIANPSAPPVVSPVLPGITIPGTGITIPLIAGLLALFIVVAVHEAAHGIVSAAHNIKVKHSGVGFFGPIPVAFVEPDEKKIEKAPRKTQLRIFAAGPWSNVIQAVIAIALTLTISFALSGYAHTDGVQFSTIQESSPAEIAGIQPDTTYTRLNGQEISNTQEFLSGLTNITPGDTIRLDDQEVILGANQEEQACIGVSGITNSYAENDFRIQKPILASTILYVQEVLYWIFVLALGLGLANLLPLGPVDGGRMILHPLQKLFSEEVANKIWSGLAKALILILLILLFIPIIKTIIAPATVAATCLPL